VILYEMLAGETPFSGPDPFLILNAKTHSDASSPRKIASEISPALEEIVLRTLERDPLNRYRDARELAWDLEHQDQVATGSSAERRALNAQHSLHQGSVFSYLLLGLIPLAILALLFYVAGHS
jgi:serine/threonine-protein kinase